MSKPSGATPKMGSLGIMAWTLRQWWAVAAGLLILRLFFAVLRGLTICAMVWAAQHAIDSVMSSMGNEGSSGYVTPSVVALGLVGFWGLLGYVDRAVYYRAHDRLDKYLDFKIIRKSSELDLVHVESAGRRNLLSKLHALSYMPCGLLDSVFEMIRLVVGVAGLCVLVLPIGWPAYALFGVALSVGGIRMIRSARAFDPAKGKEYRRLYRSMHHFHEMLSGKQAAKEVRLFGLRRYFTEKYTDVYEKVHRQGRIRLFDALLFAVPLGAALFFAFKVIEATVDRSVSLGLSLAGLSALALLFEQCSSSLARLAAMFKRAIEPITAHEEFMRIEPSIVADPSLPGLPEDLSPGLELRNVSLTYPGGDSPAIDDVTLRIAPGERVALVGENGSGKTTFVKLLTRLYDPTAGTVMAAGKGIKDYSLDLYRRKFGVIFQDFMKYHATAAENVAYAQHERIDDIEGVKEALEKTGGGQVVERLADGVHTRLGAWFDDGADLSEGQWQKIALARAFFRHADILVLDEPTSVLDARTEYEIFQRFLELTEGKTTILISHRFSTVRMADRIFVFDKGRVSERGSHRELMDLDGQYARMFNMQASGYRIH